MSGNQGDFQNYSDLDRAKQLRLEAAAIERKGWVKSKIGKMIETSNDAEYNKYLFQMLKDLESGKATPEQVEAEAQRSYEVYKRMALKSSHSVAGISGAKMPQTSMPQAPTGLSTPMPQKQPKDTVEFKVGIHAFSLIGAVFILAAFIIFGFNFLDRMAQGICLYVVALGLVLMSEFLLYKKTPKFSYVITGIGVAGLYIANIVNYFILHTMNGFVTMIITLVIAVGTILLSRKKDSTTMRLISILGCYICLIPLEGFETELSFLILVVMLFVINTVCVFFQNQRHQTLINVLHLFLNIIFTFILIGTASVAEISVIYLFAGLIAQFAFVNIMTIIQCKKSESNVLFVCSCIGSAYYFFFLCLMGHIGPGIEQAGVAPLVHMIVEVLVIAICVVVFMLWDKKDSRRWVQVYYAVCPILLLSSFSQNMLEGTLAIIVALFAVRLLNTNKPIWVLDCVMTAWVGISGLVLWNSWDTWLLLGALILSSVLIRPLPIYHEIVITISALNILWKHYVRCLSTNLYITEDWIFPMSVALLLILFLLYNHLPKLKGKKQKPYNIVSAIFMLIYYLVTLGYNSIITAVMMVLGTITILVIFRERYEMFFRRKYLLLAVFLTIYALLGRFELPIIVSILLMIIAFGCVGIGFKQRDKVERICGLVLAFFVCIKLVVYDFREVETIYKVAVFLIVGILMEVRMKRKLKSCIICFFVGACLVGCGNAIPDMTQQEQEMIVEYAASKVLEYDKNSDSKLMTLELEQEVVEEVAPANEGEQPDEIPDLLEAEDADVTIIDNTEDGAENQNVPIETFFQLEGVEIAYNGYETTSSYPTENTEDTYFYMSATDGMQLVVLNFLVKNVTNEDVELDIAGIKPRFKIEINGVTKNALTTLLLNDMSYYKGTIQAGENVELVLVCEMPVEENIAPFFTLIMKSVDDTATISLN